MKPDLVQLWQRYKEEDDQKAREELVIHYSYLVKYMANRLAITFRHLLKWMNLYPVE